MYDPFVVAKYKVAAYITAYEDPEAVMLCVQAIRTQILPVQKIFIVDNSDQKSFLASAENIIVKYFPENRGVGEGLRLAVEWSIREKYDFLWTFDQDSIAQKDCLSKLLYVYASLNKPNYLIGIVAPTAIDNRKNQIIEGAVFVRDRFIGYKASSQKEPYECDSPITSGSLISIAAAKTISPPRSDLFIDGVDLDYGLRLKQKGFHNLIVPSAVMQHSFGQPVKVKFFHTERVIQQYSALRHYYICRNHTYLDTRYAQGWYRLTSCLRRLKYMLHSVVLILLYAPKGKIIRSWACLVGTFHGLKGKLGKTWL